MANNTTMTALKSIGLVVAGVIVGLLFSVVKSDNLGGVYNKVQNHFERGIVAGTSQQFEIEDDGDVVSTADATFDDATFNGGTLNVSTSNSATSTIVAGCIQVSATSTGSPTKLVPGKIASTATTTIYGETSLAIMYLVQGTCPNL